MDTQHTLKIQVRNMRHVSPQEGPLRSGALPASALLLLALWLAVALDHARDMVEVQTLGQDVQQQLILLDLIQELLHRQLSCNAEQRQGSD